MGADVLSRSDGVRAAILGKWAPWIGGLLAFAVLLIAGCTDAEVPTVSPPPGVVRFTQERSFDAVVANTEVDLLMGLRPRYGRMEAQRWQVPRRLSWEQLVAYYGKQLGPQWKHDPRQPEMGSGYRSRVWYRDRGLLRPPVAFALAYLDGVPADFAVLIVAESALDWVSYMPPREC